MSELKPCPFCGNPSANKPQIVSYYNSYSGRQYFVACPCCGATSRHSRSKDEAVKAWNRRANLGSCENGLIVRCENCKHYNRTGCSEGFGWCERLDAGTNDDFYCWYVNR